MATRGPRTEGGQFDPKRRLQPQARPVGTSYYQVRPQYDPAAGGAETISRIGEAFSQLSPSLNKLMEVQHLAFREQADVEAERIAEMVSVQEARDIANKQWKDLQKQDPNLIGANPYLIYRVQEGVGARLAEDYRKTLRDNVVRFSDPLDQNAEENMSAFMAEQREKYAGMSFYAQTAFDQAARAAENEFKQQTDAALRSRRMDEERRQTTSKLIDAIDNDGWGAGNLIDLELDGHWSATGDSGRDLLMTAFNQWSENLIQAAESEADLEIAHERINLALANLMEHSVAGVAMGEAFGDKIDAIGNATITDVERRENVLKQKQREAKSEYTEKRYDIIAGYANGVYTEEDAMAEIKKAAGEHGQQFYENSARQDLDRARLQKRNEDRTSKAFDDELAVDGAMQRWTDGEDYAAVVESLSPDQKRTVDEKIQAQQNGTAAMREKALSEMGGQYIAAVQELKTKGYMSAGERARLDSILVARMDKIKDDLEAFVREQGYTNGVDPEARRAVEEKARELYNAALEEYKDEDGEVFGLTDISNSVLTERAKILQTEPDLGEPKSPDNPLQFMSLGDNDSSWIDTMTEHMRTPEFQKLYNTNRDAALEELREMQEAWEKNRDADELVDPSSLGTDLYASQESLRRNAIKGLLKTSRTGGAGNENLLRIKDVPDMGYFLSDQPFAAADGVGNRMSWSFADIVSKGDRAEYKFSNKDWATRLQEIDEHIQSEIVRRIEAGTVRVVNGRLIGTLKTKRRGAPDVSETDKAWRGAHAALLTIAERRGLSLEELEGGYLVMSNGTRVNVPDKLLRSANTAFLFAGADDLIQAMEKGTANDRVSQYSYDGRYQTDERNMRRQMAFALLNDPDRREDLETAFKNMFGKSIMEK